MARNKQLDLSESSDFQYLLELMLPLYNEPAYAWLPELFSIIGYENLITLCKFAGGETIKIPTIEELTESVEALEWYYRLYISKNRRISEVPPRCHEKLSRIIEVYKDARKR